MPCLLNVYLLCAVELVWLSFLSCLFVSRRPILCMLFAQTIFRTRIFLPLQDGESKIVTVKSVQLLGSFFQHKVNQKGIEPITVKFSK